MTRRAPLPKITECVETTKASDGLGRTRLALAIYPFLLICGLCLAHVHLQFVRTDMLVQQGQLQGQQRLLLRKQAAMEGAKENLCDVNNLKVVARQELNMVERDYTNKDILATIPQAVQVKYSQPLSPLEGDVMVAELRNDRESSRLKNALLSLLEGGNAVASVASERP